MIKEILVQAAQEDIGWPQAFAIVGVALSAAIMVFVIRKY